MVLEVTWCWTVAMIQHLWNNIWCTQKEANKDINKAALDTWWLKFDKYIKGITYLCNFQRKISETLERFVLSHCTAWHYLHELYVSDGVQQAHPQMFFFVVHCYHIKADHFRDRQQDWEKKTYRGYFNRHPHRNPNAFDLIPRYNGTVSAKSMREHYGSGNFYLEQWWFFFLPCWRAFQGLMLNKSVYLMKYRL